MAGIGFRARMTKPASATSRGFSPQGQELSGFPTQGQPLRHPMVEASALAPEIGEASLFISVRAELLPWCLGTGDPVRERVEAREREADE